MSDTTVSAAIYRVLFQSEDSDWCVIEAHDDDGIARRLTGLLPNAAEGMRIEASGQWSTFRDEPVFRVDQARLYRPQTIQGIARFLSSDAVHGVGPELAKSIVNAFGEETLDVISNNPEKLTTVRGLGPKRAERLSEALRAHTSRLDAMVFLHERFGEARAERVYSAYGDRAPDIIGRNPYRMVCDIEGIGFATADGLASGLGFASDSHERVSAGIMHVIKTALMRGHTALPARAVTDQAVAILQVPVYVVGHSVSRLCDEGALASFQIGHAIYYCRPDVGGAEDVIAQRLASISIGRSTLPRIDVGRAIEWVNAHSELAMSNEQCLAIQAALTQKVTVISGGPGTGKTAVLWALTRILNAKRIKLHLCAPTGLAARRMRDSTGFSATTIHRLLQYDPAVSAFTRNANHPLDTGVAIVDEASMCDVRLMCALTRAMTPQSRLILIGDSDQLPSVGAGCVLRDVILSRVAPVNRLTQTFRQAKGSPIISIARQVKDGEMPRLDYDQGVVYVPEVRSHRIMDMVIEQVMGPIKAMGFDVRDDVQVIVPKNEGTLSVAETNRRMQQAINPAPGSFFKRRGQVIGVGDKVMQTINDLDRELSNGDIGVVVEVGNDGKNARVALAHGVVDYDSAQLGQLTLAYGVTCHKSQGSEYPVVVLGIDRASHILLDRTLLYTGITRAKKHLVIVGDRRAIRSAVHRDESLKRETTLAHRLARALRSSPQESVEL